MHKILTMNGGDFGVRVLGIPLANSPGDNSSSMSNNTCLLESASPKEWFKCRIRTAEGGAPGLSIPDKNPVPAIVFIVFKNVTARPAELRVYVRLWRRHYTMTALNIS